MMKAMIFAAGLGKRLKEITSSRPKALVDLNGKTALHRAVEYCTLNGFNDIIVNVHHFADMVEDEIDNLNKMGYRISVSDERDMLLENAGGLYKARKFFNDDPFLFYNVDIVTNLDLNAMFRYYEAKGGLAVSAVRHRPDKKYFLIDEPGRLRGWCNVETGEKLVPGNYSGELSLIANSSVHIISPEIFKYMHEGIYSLVTLYLELLADNEIWTFLHDDGYWIDIGTQEDLRMAREVLSSLKSPE